MSKRTTTLDILARKGKAPLVVLTAYTAPMAKLLDAHVDMLLVGDSLGMVIYGMESTLPVTLDMMINHGKAVVGAASKAIVVVDLPFGTYQASPSQAFESSARVLAETGATAVKLEGGKEMAETISFLTHRGVPVVGHVGLKPQSVHALGGYRYQGRNDAEAAQILDDAKAVEDAGAFAIVLEGVREDIAAHITSQLKIPTIGIGASPTCDGQVLVIDDMLGLTANTPSFVKHYAQLSHSITAAVKTYAEEVTNRTFPGAEHCFKGKK
ncbi:MAG: 3-methyl-2-oxobutanoate hydroxymethyltransferase [Alphaproteobacteria bacterium]|nr:3-methyl-2-oxobutanoate hydroxymethyltransferase [Alphaproteobacteria bacterium]